MAFMSARCSGVTSKLLLVAFKVDPSGINGFVHWFPDAASVKDVFGTRFCVLCVFILPPRPSAP